MTNIFYFVFSRLVFEVIKSKRIMNVLPNDMEHASQWDAEFFSFFSSSGDKNGIFFCNCD